MSKIKLILFLFILLIGLSSHAELLKFYQKGEIQISPSPDFGKNSDWESIFLKNQMELTVSPESDIFVTDSSTHTVFHFSPNGDLLAKFGQKGQGPGDLFRPGDISILDGKYLVIGNYASQRCISLFDFTGKFIKSVRTNHSVFSPIALKNNKIAYLYYRYENTTNSFRTRLSNVVIKNISDGSEIKVDTLKIPDNSLIRDKNGRGGVQMDNLIGKAIIARTSKGNLLVGASNSPEIKIYSEKGQLKKTFNLDFKPLPATTDYINKYRHYKLSRLRSSKSKAHMADILKKASFKNLFGDHLPYYYEILVDTEGNILVFKWQDCFEDCNHIFRVYTPEGKYVCETRLINNSFKMTISNFKRNTSFTRQGIITILESDSEDDESIKLVKIKR